jgi:photosystem II stability/assembly factor-like uncharacterized protein
MAVQGSSIWLSVSETSSTHANQTLLHSSDGGNSFSAQQSPCSTGLGGTLTASSARVLWATCPTGTLGSAHRSKDAGASWESLNVGHEIANSSQLAPASATSAVLATGDQAQLLRTTDAGASFAVVQPVGAGSWGQIEFGDALHGYALRVDGQGSDESVYTTDDGGATWHKISVN